MTDLPFRCNVWNERRGIRITRRIEFHSEAGARRYAAEESHHAPSVAITTPDESGQQPGARIADYQRGRDLMNTNPIPAEPEGDTDMSDTGTIVKPAPATKTTAAKKETVIKRKNPVTIEALLGMSDSAIANLPVEQRPDIDAGNLAGYRLVYLRFLTGLRKWYPNPWMSKVSAEDGLKDRIAVRKHVAKAAGVKVGNADGRAPKLVRAPKAAATPTPKPAAKPAAAKAPAKPAAKKAPAAKRPTPARAAAKKPTATKQVAAKRNPKK